MAAARKGNVYTRALFAVRASMADEAAGLLISRGALGCAVAEMDKPGRKPRKVVTLEAYFPRRTRVPIAALNAALDKAGILAGGAPPPRAIADPGWATMWQERFKPFRIGTKFLVAPPWNRRGAPGRTSIVISPGLGFGTGHHPSTAGVMRAIEAQFAVKPEIGSALDVGTGSGILAFAIASMGARVTAIDIDRAALGNARENSALNRASWKIRFSGTPIEKVRGKFDLIAANILSSVLIAIATELIKRLNPGGRLVMGGILASEAGTVVAAYRRLRTVAIMPSRGWATIVMAR